MKQAALALVIRGETALILLRGETAPSLPGYWALPGGNPEVGESLQETAVRELTEETGLEVSSSQFLGSFPSSVPDYVCDVFLIGEADPTQPVRISWEHSAYCWIGLQELKCLEPVGTLTRQILNVYL